MEYNMLEFLFIVLLCMFSLSGCAVWGYVQGSQAKIKEQQRRLRILEGCCDGRGKLLFELRMENEQLLMLHQGLVQNV